jgi:hypothetical protein
MKVLSAMKTGEFNGKYGRLFKYAVQFEGQDEAVELNQKPDSPAPKAGDILEGTIETTQYGRRFKRAQSGGFGGGFKADPERQKSIEWQSARRDALDYCIAKARLLFDLKKTKEAEEELSGKHIFEVALYFKGIETGATQLEKKKVPPEIEPERTDDDFTDEEVEEAVEEV